MRSLVAGTRMVPMVLLCCLLGWSGPARAQEVRPEAIAAASAAFREGQSAQIAGDYARAAEMFELADSNAPSPAALRSAIRNRRAAGDVARAASLSADAIARYPDDAETRAVADEVLAALAPALGHLILRCEPACTALIDGLTWLPSAASAGELYVEPGEHTVVASWMDREPVSETRVVTAGETATLELLAPESVAEAEPVYVEDPESDLENLALRVPIDVPPRPEPGITPVVFISLASLTAISAGVLIWSGVDVLSARDAYVAAPSLALYQDGTSREVRTNVLVGITSALAVGTLVVSFFTEFGANSSDDTAGLDVLGAVPMVGGGAAFVGGHF